MFSEVKTMLDLKRNLKGATPEKLARVLLRTLRSRTRAKAAARSQVAVEQAAPDQPADRVAHLSERP